MFKLSDYDYDLPTDRIAQDLASPPDSTKLLVYDKTSGTIQDHVFHELPSLIPHGSHLFFNTSKVVKARIPVPEYDGEIFFLETTSDKYTFEALVRPGKKMKVGSQIILGDYTFQIIDMTDQGRVVRCSHPILEVLEAIGQMPLPPYIGYDASKSDSYQPLQAKQPGSVAAPTASLHFTPQTFADLKERGCMMHEVTLHIGLGTFKQVDSEDIQAYDIHSERAEVTLGVFQAIMKIQQSDTPLIAVGTTVTRTLETLPYLRKALRTSPQASDCFDDQTTQYRDALTAQITDEQVIDYVKSWKLTGQGTITTNKNQGGYDITPDQSLTTIQFESTLYIYPGFEYHVIDSLITNFHLPKSTLLMLVAGYIGHENMKALYQHAIGNGYKFYSFGDAMLIK